MCRIPSYFQHSSISRLSSQCVIGLKTSLKIPSHLKYVATLRREICGIFLTHTVQFVLHSLIIILVLLVGLSIPVSVCIRAASC